MSIKHNKITIHRPNARKNLSIFKTLLNFLNNAVNSQDLIRVLYKRDLLAQYKKSFIGYGWIFITPFIGILSWVFMNATGVLAPGDVGIPYPAYVLVSSSIYGLFGGFMNSASSTLEAGRGFINQVNYPHEALFIKQLLQQFTNFGLNFTIILIAIMLFAIYPSWKIIFFPVLVLPFLFLGGGVGLILAIVKVVAPDVTKIYNMGIGFLMYLTPVVYSAKDQDPLLQTIIEWNPLTYILEGIRGTILYGDLPNPIIYWLIFVVTFLFFVLCLRFFYLSEQRVIEKMI